MNEQEWLESTNPEEMLDEIRHGRSCILTGDQGVSNRKLRMFCCEMLHYWLRKEGRSAPNVEEIRMVIDGSPTVICLDESPSFPDSVRELILLENPDRAAFEIHTALHFPFLHEFEDRAKVGKIHADMLRHIVGNPFRPKAACELDCIDPDEGYHAAGCVRAKDGIVKLAQAIYEDGRDDFALHDTLLEEGRPDLAEHFDGTHHPKGCWAIDLLLGKA